ncbi:hypothetical protein Tco_0583716 [Tanacetum coccineum]
MKSYSEFQLHRGWKQGDPLAPFVHSIMEFFIVSSYRAVEGVYFTVYGLMMLSHLSIVYADDAIYWRMVPKEILKGSFDSYPSTWNSIIKDLITSGSRLELFAIARLGLVRVARLGFGRIFGSGTALYQFISALFALDTEKEISLDICTLLDSVILSNSNDRWISDLNETGLSCLTDVERMC